MPKTKKTPSQTFGVEFNVPMPSVLHDYLRELSKRPVEPGQAWVAGYWEPHHMPGLLLECRYLCEVLSKEAQHTDDYLQVVDFTHLLERWMVATAALTNPELNRPLRWEAWRQTPHLN